MPTEPKKTAPAPITERELPEFLLWFFTHTGHADHVATWRATKDKPAPASRAPAGDNK